MKLKDIVKTYRTENNLTQREFAAKCHGISHAYIAIIENDVNPNTGKPPRPSMDKLKSIANGMGMELDDLLAKMGERKKVELLPTAQSITLDSRLTSAIEDVINERINERLKQNAIPGADTIPYTPPRARVPIIGVVRCGAGGLALEEPLGFEGADVANAEDYFYLRATGDSMEPKIFEGDLVLIHRQPDVENGEMAVVVVDGKEGMLKQVIKKPGALILQSYNPAHPPRVFIGEEMQMVEIAGKAVSMLRKW